MFSYGVTLKADLAETKNKKSAIWLVDGNRICAGGKVDWDRFANFSANSVAITNTRSPLLRFRSALHCGYSGIIVVISDIQDGLFFVLTSARTFNKS
jgi:hypothetical protein